MAKRIPASDNYLFTSGNIVLFKDDIKYIFDLIGKQFSEKDIKIKDDLYEYDNIQDYIDSDRKISKSLEIEAYEYKFESRESRYLYLRISYEKFSLSADQYSPLLELD